MLNLTNKAIKENKETKAKNNTKKSPPNFLHYLKKIEAQSKKWFSYIKKRVSHELQ